MKKLIVAVVVITLLCGCSAPANESTVSAELDNLRQENGELKSELSGTKSQITQLEQALSEMIKATTPTPSPAPALTAELQTKVLGEVIEMGDFEICMDQYEITNKIKNTYGSFAPDAGNSFLVVRGKITNNAKSAQTFLKSFRMIGEDIDAYLAYEQEYKFTLTNLLFELDEVTGYKLR